MRLRLAVRILLGVLVSWPSYEAAAENTEVCLYQDDQGKIQQVNSRERVPVSKRSQARCFSAKQHQYLAAPQDIELKGTTRREDMVSSVGRIELRWPRKVETLFGRTPQRAMADAATSVSRALRSAGFPPKLQSLNLDWKVVFMDEEVPERQIPTYLVNNCHPAWMTPPSNIYVVAQRAAAGCGAGQTVRTSDADARLAHILIHEMGHAIEYQLLEGAQSGDRMRAEGFASWFEQFGADYSSVIPKGSVRALYASAGKASLRASPGVFHFSGSFEDYARAALYFRAIEERRGVRGVMDVYSLIRDEGLPLLSAIERRMSWDSARIQSEVGRLVQ